MATESVAQDQLRAFIERIERMEEEKKAISDDIKEIYAEAKGNGFETKVLRQIIRIRKMDEAERLEQEAIMELYLAALGMAVAPREEECTDGLVESVEQAVDLDLAARFAVEGYDEFEPAEVTPPLQGGASVAVSLPAHNHAEETGAEPVSSATTDFDPGTGAGGGATAPEGDQTPLADVEASAGTVRSEKVEAQPKDQNGQVPSSDGGPIPGAAGSIAPRIDSNGQSSEAAEAVSLPPERIGSRVRAKRAERGWTKAALAEALDTTVSRIGQIEDDRCKLRAGEITAIAEALGCSGEFILHGTAGAA